MLRRYGYLGLAMVLFAQLNFYLGIMPLAEWYIPIVWYGYILVVDSLVLRLRGKSLITSYPREFVFLCAISLPFWLISEAYNIVSITWVYSNYVWYIHLIDFTTIMPAVLETFALLSAIGAHGRLRSASSAAAGRRLAGTALLAGFAMLLLPFAYPDATFPTIWMGLFLVSDSLNCFTGGASILGMLERGGTRIPVQLMASGLMMGFFWEFWNFQAYPKWIYQLLPVFQPAVRLFEMPLIGYIGYLPFAWSVLSFYELLRRVLFRGANPLLEMASVRA